MELAVANLFRARWTTEIHDEWSRNVLADRPDIKPEQLDRTMELMNRAVPDCLVDGYKDLITSLTLPDENDRHVLAAAIKSGADAIITFNLKDFPRTVLEQYGIEAQHPDEFIHHQVGLNEPAVIICAQRCRTRLRNPPMTADEYLKTLATQQLPQTIAALRPFAAVL